MEVNAYVLRAILARQDLDDEGAAQVGTSLKEHLGGATTVEEALRFLNERTEDDSGFNELYSIYVNLMREHEAPLEGAGIKITRSSPDHRIDAKGNLSRDYLWLNQGIPPFPGDVAQIRPYLRDTNQWEFETFSYPIVPPTTRINEIWQPADVDIGQTFTIRILDNKNIPVTFFEGNWGTLKWPGGVMPPQLGNVTLYCFVKLALNKYDGFLLANNLDA